MAETKDSFQIVQAVSGLVSDRNALREQLASLEGQLFTKNQDNQRLQKNVSDYLKQLEEYKAKLKKANELIDNLNSRLK